MHVLARLHHSVHLKMCLCLSHMKYPSPKNYRGVGCGLQAAHQQTGSRAGSSGFPIEAPDVASRGSRIKAHLEPSREDCQQGRLCAHDSAPVCMLRQNSPCILILWLKEAAFQHTGCHAGSEDSRVREDAERRAGGRGNGLPRYDQKLAVVTTPSFALGTLRSRTASHAFRVGNVAAAVTQDGAPRSRIPRWRAPRRPSSRRA